MAEAGAPEAAPAAARRSPYVSEVVSEDAAEELSPAAQDARERIRTGRYAIDLSELADALVGSLGADGGDG